MAPSSFPPNSSIAGPPDRRRPACWPTYGETLGDRYRLLEPIGAGGMSVIWRAVDLELGRHVAIKIPEPEQGVPVDLDALVRNEARTVAALSHPDVVVVHDVGQASRPDGTTVTYLVLQMLAGESLLDVLTTGPLGWHRAAGIGARLARVLAAVHTHGVVHRDVTPDNVMVDGNNVKLLDFGIAARVGDRPTRSWTLGTPPYLAPERLADAPADPAADIYSLGALLVEMLTGQPPDGSVSLSADIPEELTQLCRRCLDPEPIRRPSAAETAADLQALTGPVPSTSPASERIRRDTTPIDTAATAVPGPVGDEQRRSGLSIAVAAMLAATAVAVTTVVVLLAASPSPQHPAPSTPPEVARPSVSPSPASPPPTSEPARRRIEPHQGTRTGRTTLPPTTIAGTTPKVTTPAASSVLSVTRAADELRDLLRRDVLEGAVTAHAAQKIGAQVDNVVNNQGALPENQAQLVADLRRSVADEIRNGGVSTGAATTLDAAVERVAEAVNVSATASG
ncbi:serine/threonine-protein kinase [Verrucosispora sp. WMMD573]|uniref:serine/threonine-protein kinase n=1 Tax=Verrucosispora sp. WMMD573 TaxID=3015149 RepID=UPI00248CF3C7|nr:serine/threonine-protein kinase [Verrucosispora sp. WMMD573]WBB54666.1 serine/threonine-protein kinase [Verrucosispora sp. WMMD573]